MKQYPNHANKHELESMIDPGDFLRYWFGVQKTEIPADFPEDLIIVYSRGLHKSIKDRYATTDVVGMVDLLEISGKRIGLCRLGIGAPAAVVGLEERIALGVKRVVTVGTAGSLQPGLAVGDVVLCDRAVRDEGTSHHYAPAGKWADGSAAMRQKLVYSLDKLGVSHRTGPSWTIDAPYRETRDEVLAYQSDGIATVEMEASAMFAVGTYRSVDVGVLLAISDTFASGRWEPEFHSKSLDATLNLLVDVAVDALGSANIAGHR